MPAVNRVRSGLIGIALPLSLLVAVSLCLTPMVEGQSFDFAKLDKKIARYAVIIKMEIEVSFGMHSSIQEERLLGTIVSDDGVVIFNGTSVAGETAMPSFSGFTIKSTPGNVKVLTLDGREYEAEYLGVERFTRIAFVKIKGEPGETFEAVRFRSDPRIEVGRWLALYMLLPEVVSPPLAADVGMISALVESPEFFPLTVGFSSLQTTSLVFDEDLEPIGVLGSLLDPTSASAGEGGLIERFGQFGMPLLGVVTGERLDRILADPPREGKVVRGWLGITLQALTEDIAEFWNLDLPGGIIVSDIIKHSPADKSGLQVGDIIYEVDSRPVEVDREEKLPVFQRNIAEFGPGSLVDFSIIRLADSGQDSLKLTAVLEAAPMAPSDAPEYENDALEFGVRNLVFADYMIYQLDAETFQGVVVSEIRQGGPANVGGLQLGDIIQRIGSDTIASVEDADSAMQQIEQAQPSEVIFFVWRNNKTMFVNVKTSW